jgi:hypothetical protein
MLGSSVATFARKIKQILVVLSQLVNVLFIYTVACKMDVNLNFLIISQRSVISIPQTVMDVSGIKLTSHVVFA